MSELYRLKIEKTLYFFEEPILFVAKVGFLDCLFLKTDELEEGNEFLSCAIDQEVVDALMEGRISIRGAFEGQKDNYIVAAKANYDVLWERKAREDELEERLPERNVGVFEWLGDCPDTLQEKDAFLSIYFQGNGLNRRHIQYSVLMRLLGSVQALAKDVIMPPALRGVRSSTIDFLVGDPALGSLMISIKEPTFNVDRLRQTQDDPNLTANQLLAGATGHKDAFFKGVSDLVNEPAKFKKEADAKDNLFRDIAHLLPSDETPYSNIVLATQSGRESKRISIDTSKADAVRRAFGAKQTTRTSKSGIIVEINAASATVLLRSRQGSITTCGFERQMFEELRDNEVFKIGTRMIVGGDLTPRARRDYLWVRKVTLGDSRQ